MYYVRAYVRMHLCVCVRRQSAVHMSVCRYDCSHAFGMRAGIHASICLFACACERASVRVFMGMSVLCLCLVHACIHECIFKRPWLFLHLTSYF